MTTRQEFDTTAHTCWNCGNQSHLRSKCPAKILNVSNVDVKNIFQKFIAPKTFTQQTFFVMFPSLTWLDGPRSNLLSKSLVHVYIDNHKFHALIDSGSTDNLIHQQVIDQLSLNVISIDSSVSIASIAHVKSVSRYVINK